MRPINPREYFESFWAAKQAGLHVYLVGRIESYDATTQTATVKPLLKDEVKQEDGTTAVESLPVLQGVPVAFPGGGGMRMTFPVAAGDYCELHFSDRSLDQWKAKGGEVDPIDRARHALKDAVARVGIRPPAAPWSGADASCVTIGSDAGAAEFVATATRVLTELNKLKDAINGHTHASNGTAPTSGVAGIPVSVSAPASATVKIKG
jgi:hypothetical protein